MGTRQDSEGHERLNHRGEAGSSGRGSPSGSLEGAARIERVCRRKQSCTAPWASNGKRRSKVGLDLPTSVPRLRLVRPCPLPTRIHPAPACVCGCLPSTPASLSLLYGANSSDSRPAFLRGLLRSSPPETTLSVSNNNSVTHSPLCAPLCSPLRSCCPARFCATRLLLSLPTLQVRALPGPPPNPASNSETLPFSHLRRPSPSPPTPPLTTTTS